VCLESALERQLHKSPIEDLDPCVASGRGQAQSLQL